MRLKGLRLSSVNYTVQRPNKRDFIILDFLNSLRGRARKTRVPIGVLFVRLVRRVR